MFDIKPITPEAAYFMALVIARVLREARSYFEIHKERLTLGKLAGWRELEQWYWIYADKAGRPIEEPLCCSGYVEEEAGALPDEHKLDAAKFVYTSLMYACRQAPKWFQASDLGTFRRSLRTLHNAAAVEYKEKKSHSQLASLDAAEGVSKQALSPYFVD